MSIVNHIVDDTVVFGGFSSKQDYCRILDVWAALSAKKNVQLATELVDYVKSKQIVTSKQEGVSFPTLDLSGCELKDEAAACAIEALAMRPIVAKLDISGSELSTKTVDVLLRLLRGQAKLVRSVSLEDRIHVALLGEVILDYSESLNNDVLQEVSMLSSALNVVNAQAYIYSVFKRSNLQAPFTAQKLVALWDIVLGDTLAHEIESAQLSAGVSVSMQDTTTTSVENTLSYGDVEAVLLCGLIDRGLVSVPGEWQMDAIGFAPSWLLTYNMRAVSNALSSASLSAPGSPRSPLAHLSPHSPHSPQMKRSVVPVVQVDIPETELSSLDDGIEHSGADQRDNRYFFGENQSADQDYSFQQQSQHVSPKASTASLFTAKYMQKSQQQFQRSEQGHDFSGSAKFRPSAAAGSSMLQSPSRSNKPRLGRGAALQPKQSSASAVGSPPTKPLVARIKPTTSASSSRQRRSSSIDSKELETSGLFIRYDTIRALQQQGNPGDHGGAHSMSSSMVSGPQHAYISDDFMCDDSPNNEISMTESGGGGTYESDAQQGCHVDALAESFTAARSGESQAWSPSGTNPQGSYVPSQFTSSDRYPPQGVNPVKGSYDINNDLSTSLPPPPPPSHHHHHQQQQQDQHGSNSSSWELNLELGSPRKVNVLTVSNISSSDYELGDQLGWPNSRAQPVSVLILRDNGIAFPERLSLPLRFDSLIDLDLSYNSITGSVKGLPNTLQRLNLSHNRISNVSALLECAILVELNLSHNNIKSFHRLPPKLERLNISYNVICTTITLRTLALSPGIRELDVANNPILLEAKDWKVIVSNVLADLTELNGKPLLFPKKANEAYSRRRLSSPPTVSSSPSRKPQQQQRSSAARPLSASRSSSSSQQTSRPKPSASSSVQEQLINDTLRMGVGRTKNKEEVLEDARNQYADRFRNHSNVLRPHEVEKLTQRLTAPTKAFQLRSSAMFSPPRLVSDKDLRSRKHPPRRSGGENPKTPAAPVNFYSDGAYNNPASYDQGYYDNELVEEDDAVDDVDDQQSGYNWEQKALDDQAGRESSPESSHGSYIPISLPPPPSLPSSSSPPLLHDMEENKAEGAEEEQEELKQEKDCDERRTSSTPAIPVLSSASSTTTTTVNHDTPSDPLVQNQPKSRSTAFNEFFANHVEVAKYTHDSHKMLGVAQEEAYEEERDENTVLTASEEDEEEAENRDERMKKGGDVSNGKARGEMFTSTDSADEGSRSRDKSVTHSETSGLNNISRSNDSNVRNKDDLAPATDADARDSYSSVGGVGADSIASAPADGRLNVASADTNSADASHAIAGTSNGTDVQRPMTEQSLDDRSTITLSTTADFVPAGGEDWSTHGDSRSFTPSPLPAQALARADSSTSKLSAKERLRARLANKKK